VKPGGCHRPGFFDPFLLGGKDAHRRLAEWVRAHYAHPATILQAPLRRFGETRARNREQNQEFASVSFFEANDRRILAEKMSIKWLIG
jgi:hypothetical protein